MTWLFTMADEEGREMGRRDDNGRRDEEEDGATSGDDGNASVPVMTGLDMFTESSGAPSPCPSAVAENS